MLHKQRSRVLDVDSGTVGVSKESLISSHIEMNDPNCPSDFMYSILCSDQHVSLVFFFKKLI